MPTSGALAEGGDRLKPKATAPKMVQRPHLSCILREWSKEPADGQLVVGFSTRTPNRGPSGGSGSERVLAREQGPVDLIQEIFEQLGQQADRFDFRRARVQVREQFALKAVGITDVLERQ